MAATFADFSKMAAYKIHRTPYCNVYLGQRHASAWLPSNELYQHSSRRPDAEAPPSCCGKVSISLQTTETGNAEVLIFASGGRGDKHPLARARAHCTAD